MKQLSILLLSLFCMRAAAQNIGIGETAPTAMKLQVKAADSAVILVHNSITTGVDVKTGLYFKTGNNYSGGIATIGTSATFRMGLFTYGGAAPSALLERISILDGGNVGIGTTTPGAKLEINGAIKITGGNPGAGKILESDASGLGSWVDKPGGVLPAGVSGNTLRHNGTSFIATSNLYNDGSRIGIGTTAPASMLEIKPLTGTADIEINAATGDNAVLRLNRNGVSNGSIIRFKKSGVNQWDMGSLADDNFKLKWVATNTTVMDVDEATLNIGLGTNDFTDKLNINGNASAYGAFTSKGSVAAFQFVDRTANAYGGWSLYADAGKAHLFRFGGLGNTLTIDATGRMGIGNASPGSPLSFPNAIGKKISLYPGPTGDAGFGVFGNELRINSDYNGADITLGFDNFTNGFTERMRIKGTGNVGIGTNNPLDKLEVRGALGEGILVSSASQSVEITTGLLGANVGTSTASTLNFITGNNIAASISPAGNMGIGAGASIYKLDINGRMRLRHNGSTSGIWFNNSGNVETGFIGQYTDNLWGFFGNGAWKFAINETDGTVMLGSSNLDAENLTNASGYKLKVFGKIIGEEVRVQLKTAWPDYVFEKNYNRLSIDEMETFIAQNKHLPNIPSAAEVETNGQQLGEMQRKMMEKIEELSLYIIDLKKEIDILKQKK